MRCRSRRAGSETERDEIWNLRRELSPALKKISSIKLNNDVVVPRGRVPELFRTGRRDQGGERAADRVLRSCRRREYSRQHHGSRDRVAGRAGRAPDARRAGCDRLFEGVVALEGSISGEHGIGFTKAPYLGLELSHDEIALMKRVKAAFDPNGILNPGKIFPDE